MRLSSTLTLLTIMLVDLPAGALAGDLWGYMFAFGASC